MKNKNILITWVSFGIGNYLANNLTKDYNIYGISRRDPNIDWLNFCSVDLKDNSQIKKNIDSIKNIDFDTVIFNAWVWFFDKFQNVEDEEIIETFQINILANIFLLKELLKFISPKTKLIFIWSIAGKKFFKYWSIYQASKFALRWFVWSIRNELKNKVFLINPQFVDTSNFYKNYRIELTWKFKETKVEDIFETVSNILNWKENRFEIDL